MTARTMLERIESVIKDNIEAALPKGVSVDYRYAAVEVLRVMGDPTEAMVKAGWASHDAYEWEPTDHYQAMIAAARD